MLAGGKTQYTDIYAGGSQYNYGSSYSDYIYGVADVESGGVESSSIIEKGGREYVLRGGTTRYDTVASGGAQYDYGITSDTTISKKGGTEYVLSGGYADYNQVDGAEVVSSGGVAYDDAVRGGTLTVLSGGSVLDGLSISGGTANISGGVALGQNVLFSGAGDLALYNLSNFHARVGGFSTSDEFDLGGFAYGSSETLKYTEAASLLSGTLSIHDGSQTASLTLLGKYVTSDFALSTDAHGGSFVKFV